MLSLACPVSQNFLFFPGYSSGKIKNQAKFFFLFLFFWCFFFSLSFFTSSTDPGLISTGFLNICTLIQNCCQQNAFKVQLNEPLLVDFQIEMCPYGRDIFQRREAINLCSISGELHQGCKDLDLDRVATLSCQTIFEIL